VRDANSDAANVLLWAAIRWISAALKFLPRKDDEVSTLWGSTNQIKRLNFLNFGRDELQAVEMDFPQCRIISALSGDEQGPPIHGPVFPARSQFPAVPRCNLLDVLRRERRDPCSHRTRHAKHQACRVLIVARGRPCEHQGFTGELACLIPRKALIGWWHLIASLGTSLQCFLPPLLALELHVEERDRILCSATSRFSIERAPERSLVHHDRKRAPQRLRARQRR